MFRVSMIVMVVILMTGCARHLTLGEVVGLQKEFGDFLDYSKIRVVKQSIVKNKEFLDEIEMLRNQNTATFNNGIKINEEQLSQIYARPFVINNKIYYPESQYQKDFSPFVGLIVWGTFVHENCHALAYQLGIRSKAHGNKPYHWRLGLWEQLVYGDSAYNIPRPIQIKDTDKLTDFKFEQQCELFKFWAMFDHAEKYEPYGNLISNFFNSYENSANQAQ